MAREKLDPRPFKDLPAAEQLELKRAEESVRRWNETNGVPLSAIPLTPRRKQAGRPSSELENERGYVT